MLVQEQIVVYEQDHRHGYKLVAPATPAKDYYSEVVFTPNATGGTEIRWAGSFVEGVSGSGPMMRASLRGAIKFIVGRLVKAAERESASSA